MGHDPALATAPAVTSADVLFGTRNVYGFKTPPLLGGALEVDNVETIDFVVGLSIAGQIHDQIRGLPPGTRISGFTVSGETM